ncbi:histidinol dehydrogenase [Actinomycetota bacterium]|nr:histidinol dehydrogenase [Actinomycetota bacterium]
MQIIDLRETDIASLTKREVDQLLPRAVFDLSSGAQAVKPMLERIKSEGDVALYDFAKQFDKISQDPKDGGTGIKVPVSKLKQAFEELEDNVREALVEAKKRITLVHTAQLPTEQTTTLSDGAKVSQRWIAVERVGLYVPGGLAVYPSSVLMNAIPALVAGVKSLVVASPGQAAFGGYPHPTILAACYLLGVPQVIAVGGAGAIGAMAYGTQSVEKVDVITGPGNIFVASAKLLVQGEVGIDAIAGPTEIMVLADDGAQARFVAKDLIGQAEHDELAGSVLVTDSPELAREVNELLPEIIKSTKHSGRVQIALDGQQSAIILVKNLDDGVRIANAYGAEHLEIQTAEPEQVAQKITNAGAIFVGDYSPVSLGDYIGGSNHVLPTSGSSKFSQGLSVYAFLRSVQQINYSKAALGEVADKIVALSLNEDLPAHGEAVTVRF